MGTFRKTQIYIHADLLENYFLPNIVHANYDTYTLGHTFFFNTPVKMNKDLLRCNG